MLPALTLAVLVYSTSGDEAAAAGRQKLAAALHAQGAAIVDHAIDAALADRRAGWRSANAFGYFAEIRGLVERGRRARERVELDEATRAFAQAEALCATHAHEPGMGAVAGEAALDHGVALAELRRLEDARAAFARALGFAPTLQLTEKSARPDVVRLFRDVARAPRSPQPAPPVKDLVTDPMEAQLAPLRTGPDGGALPQLVEALGADAAVVAVASRDGKRLLAARVEAGCATQAMLLSMTTLEQGTRDLLTARCDRGAPQLAVDDPRLEPPPVVVAVAKRAPEKKAKKWPWIFVGAIGITAAVIGVTVGVVASDPRYAIKVDGRSFGAP